MDNEYSQRQLQHYQNNAECYVGSRTQSIAYQKFLDIWAERLLEPWLNVTDQDARKKQVVLDPMCGHGNLAPYILRYCDNLYLNDISPNMLEYMDEDIRKRSRVLPPTDVCCLQLEDESTDVIVVSGGLHHVYTNLPKVLCKIHRMLKPKGLLLFGEPSNEFILARVARNIIYKFSAAFDYESEKAFRYSELVRSLENIGFGNIELKPFGSIGYLLMGQIGVLPFLKRFDNPTLFKFFIKFDRMVEDNKLLSKTCFALTGSAIKFG